MVCLENKLLETQTTKRMSEILNNFTEKKKSDLLRSGPFYKLGMIPSTSSSQNKSKFSYINLNIDISKIL